MNAVRTLPIRVAPIDGEALDSWMEAIAHRTQTVWEDLLSALALRSPDNRHNTWVMRLADDEAAAISTAAGLPSDVVNAMTVVHYTERAVGINPATGRFLRAFPWGRARGSRYCPNVWPTAVVAGSWPGAWAGLSRV